MSWREVTGAGNTRKINWWFPVVGLGILILTLVLLNSPHRPKPPENAASPAPTLVTAETPSDEQIKADDVIKQVGVTAAPTPTATPYVNQLVLKYGKYIDAQSPAPTPTTAPASIWTKDELDSYFKKPGAHSDSMNPSPKTTRGKKWSSGLTIVGNKADADASHIYFGPSNDRSVITSAEMQADYDENPKAYAQGWKDGWKWASKQSDFSAESTSRNN
jgi:hypothetical protein